MVLAHGACRSESAKQPSSRPATPRRIISIAPDATEMIEALGATDRLVGVSDFCVWPPAISKLPRIGGLFDANLETILRLQPDLVVLRGHNQSVEQLCADNRIQLYFDATERFEDIYRTLRELGAILDRREEAAAVETKMRDRLGRVESAVSGQPRPRVFMTLARNPESIASIMTGARGTFIDEMIVRAGGENVFADLGMDYPSVSLEAILVAKPDVIIEAMPEVKLTPAVEADIRRQWQELAPIPAVKTGRVFILSDENCYIPSPRIVDMVAKLARLLHPEVEID